MHAAISPSPTQALPEAQGTLVVVGASARVGKSTLVDALSSAGARRGGRIVNVFADLGVRPVAQHATRMRERLFSLRQSADLIVVDCAGEREALLLAPEADVVVLVTHAAARALQDAAHRARQLAHAGVARIHVVVNMAESAEAGRVAFSLLCGTVPAAADRLVLAAVVPAVVRRAAPSHDGPSSRPRGEGPGWREAAELILGGAGAPPEAAPPIPPTLWQRVKRALGVDDAQGAAPAFM